MSLTLPHWIFLENNCIDIIDTYCFSKNITLKANRGSFAIFAEELPQAAIPARSKLGAELLVDASQLVLEKLQKKELNFSQNFFNLLNETWKAKILLHAIQNPLSNESQLSIDELTKNKPLCDSILKHYDASVNIVYLENNQLIFLQTADAQLALLNKRYNCDVKKSDHHSLSSLLNSTENSTSPKYQIIDIEKYQLEMVTLLPQQYTAPKTGARLKSNILKIYRSFENSDMHVENDTQLIILKKNYQQVIPTTTKEEEAPSPVATKTQAKKSVVAYVLSAFFLISGGMGSYFLWQVQAEEGTSPPLSKDNLSETQFALNDTPTAIPPRGKPVTIEQSKVQKQADKLELAEQNKARQREIELATKKNQEVEKERMLLLQQQEEQLKSELAAKKAQEVEKERKLLLQQQEEQLENELAAKKAQVEKEKQAAKEALKIKNIEAEKIRKENELKAKLQAEAQEKKLKLQQQQEKLSLRSIEKDLEVINRHDEKIRARQQAEAQKQRDNQARLTAEKQIETRRKEALIKQRRREFENNKNQKAQSTPVKSSTPKSRNELQVQNQEHIRKKEVEKKRTVAEELKKQQIGQVKAREAREKVIQKTITHQLINYSKTFHRHVIQLKQKNKAIALLEQRKASSNDPTNIIRSQEMLQSKKNDIEQRLDRLAVLYVGKLKKLCANNVIHPVARPAKSTEVERIALSVISQKLKSCSQPQTLSSQSISRTLINRYLK